MKGILTMANAFTKNQLSQRELYERNYSSSRHNLLLIVAFTVINLLLLVTNSGSYFLFSAYIPYFIAFMAMYLCGYAPEEYYAEGLEEVPFLDNSVFITMMVICAVIILLYLLAWFMSSKHRVGWLIFALVFFGLDTLGMLFINGFSMDSAVDILFHAWVIFSLINGIVGHYKLQKLPPEAEPVPLFDDATQEVENNQ